MKLTAFIAWQLCKVLTVAMLVGFAMAGAGLFTPTDLWWKVQFGLAVGALVCGGLACYRHGIIR